MKTRSLVASVFALILAVFALVSPAFAQDTIYNVPPQPLQQLAGGPTARAAVPTFGAIITVNPNITLVHTLNGVSTVSAAATVNCPGTGGYGQFMILMCKASASGTVTYTFSQNFLPTATAAPTASKAITVFFVSDGTVWREVSRSASAQ